MLFHSLWSLFSHLLVLLLSLSTRWSPHHPLPPFQARGRTLVPATLQPYLPFLTSSSQLFQTTLPKMSRPPLFACPRDRFQNYLHFPRLFPPLTRALQARHPHQCLRMNTLLPHPMHNLNAHLKQTIPPTSWTFANPALRIRHIFLLWTM